jgi:CHAT domain-containing protein
MRPLEDGAQGRGLRGVEGERAPDQTGEPAADLAASRREFLAQHEKHRTSIENWRPARSSSVVDWVAAQRMLGPDDALLAYVVMQKTMAIFVATRERRNFLHIPCGAEEVGQDIAELDRRMRLLVHCTTAASVMAHAARRETAREPWPSRVRDAAQAVTQQLTRLHALLLAPILPLIARKHHWAIIPYGALHRLPWTALYGGGAHVVQGHSVSILPSASVGVALSQLPIIPAGDQILLGNPDALHSRWMLPGTEDEVARCAALLGPDAKTLVDDTVTKTMVLSCASEATLLHFACHHFFDPQVPILSFIKLAGDGADALYAYEVMELRLRAQLVALSACGSGLSGSGAGDEQLGMVRAFLAGGARSVLSTLWPIDDNSPVTFFATFYARARSKGMAEALASTQRAFLEHPQFSLPCFWAPYQLTGRWDHRLQMPAGKDSGSDDRFGR